jgi:hypothetical protein
MDKKNKIIAGLAIGAVTLLVASGVARCLLAPADNDNAATAEQAATIEQQQTQEEKPEGQGGLSEIENTTWKSDDGKSTLTVLSGALIETTESGETILYYKATDVIETDTGITADLSVSKEQGGKAVQTALAITRGSGSMRLACDALSTDYSMKTGDAAIVLANVDENLTSLYGRTADDFASAISKWASSKSPYATKATWTKEVWIDYKSGSKVTAFTLDDGASSTVSVTLNAAGELVAS